MRELAKSAARYTWAMSLFGVQQAANVLAPRKADAAFFSVTQAAENEFDDLVFAAYQVGDEVQRGLTEIVFDTVTLQALNPGYISMLTSAVVEQSQESFQTFSSTENARLAWQTLKNNYEVFNLVKHASSFLNVPAENGEFDLARLIRNAYALGAYPDLWAIEGLGNLYAMTFWKKGGPIRGILTDVSPEVLPAKSLTMMHAGMGLAFAQQLMNTITPYSPPEQMRSVLREFITLVQENSRQGYDGAAYESLGLVTRFWHSQMVDIIDDHLRQIAPHLAGYYWHGVGRALYFLPLYFVPGLLSPWLAIGWEAPHELAQLNMTAGLAWATTIVNVRQPELMENFLRMRGEHVSRTSGFTNGVMSSLIMGIDTTPGDTYIQQFLKYQPKDSDPGGIEAWETLVGRPAREAVYDLHPILKKYGGLGQVFQYHASLSDLAARLEREREPFEAFSGAR
ncbi:MAG TPA: hypothetical protein VLB46_22765 [Pyrinomonadaceae bacterium]|nr:hypothetical protein [Pyrinomonadaceae bacterium]